MQNWNEKMTGVPEDACENWSKKHQQIATHETDIGDLCDSCFKAYFEDDLIDENGSVK